MDLRKKKPRKAEQSLDVEPDVAVMDGTNVIVMEVPGIGADALLDLSDRFKQRSAPAAVVLGSRQDGTVHLVANFDDSVAKRLSAGDVVKEIAPIVGGGGGGRPTMARAGGKAVEAEALFRDAVKADSSFAPAWYNLADMLDDQGRTTEAITALESAVKADPFYADAIFNLALFLQKLDRLAEAAQRWKRYLELDTDSPWAARSKRALKFCEIAGQS